MQTLAKVFIALDVFLQDMHFQVCISVVISISYLDVKAAIFIFFQWIVTSTALWKEQEEVVHGLSS